MKTLIFYDSSLLLAPVPVWVGYIGPYLYARETLPDKPWQMTTEFRNDKHLIG